MTAEARPWLRRGASRALSLLLAVPLALLLLLHPVALLDGHGRYSHALLTLVMWGICSGFIHGIGFDPYSRLWRSVFHPVGGWLLLGLGYLILWQAGS